MPDTSPATLAGIRADIEETADVYDLDGAGKNSYPVSATMVRHARSLVAALEVVLALADKESTGIPPVCIRRAITAELAGKEAGGA